MLFKKLALLAVMAIIAFSVSALTLGELQTLYYQSEYLDKGFNAEAAAFISSSEDLGDLDEAVIMWKNNDPEACSQWLAAQMDSTGGGPKFAYLMINLEDDPLEKLLLARELAAAHPDFAGGYRAILLAYFHGFDSSELFSDDSEHGAKLLADTETLLEYGDRFPDDAYSRLASVYAQLRLGDLEAASATLRIAVSEDNAWLNDLSLYDHVPLDKCHDLLALHISLLRPKSDDYSKYLAAEYADMLLDYYLEDARAYARIDEYFGAEPYSWDSSYIIYGLAASYLNLMQSSPEAEASAYAAKLSSLLYYGGDSIQAAGFQDLWLAFNPDQADQAYRAAFAGSAEPLALYLKARANPSNDERLAAARELAGLHPRLDYGYALATETYVNKLGSPDEVREVTDYLRAELVRDMQLLRNFYFRFPEETRAFQANFAASLAEGDDAEALEAYTLLDAGIADYELSQKLARMIILYGRTDLLFQAMSFDADRQVEEELLEAGKREQYLAELYCGTLYDNSLYSLVVAEAGKHPQWLEFPALQFLTVNAHYFEGDFGQTIAMLRFIVEKGNMGYTGLTKVSDPNLTSHPDWQPLLDWAQTMPDPEAETDSEEYIEPAPEEYPTDDGYYDEYGNFYEYGDEEAYEGEDDSSVDYYYGDEKLVYDDGWEDRPEPTLTENSLPYYPTLDFFDLLSNHTYTYALVWSVQDYAASEQLYTLETGEWFSRQVHHDEYDVAGDVLPYTGSRLLLRDLERMYQGPEAQINRGITILGDTDDPRLDFDPLCDCFIQIGSDVYLGYEQDNEYYTKYLIYSEDAPVYMGGLECGRAVIMGDLSNGRYRTDYLWTALSGDMLYFWENLLGYSPDFDRRVTRYEAIRDISANYEILDRVYNTDQYGEDYNFLGVNNVSSWAVMFAEPVGLFLIAMDVCDDIFYGSAYVLVDW